LAAQGWGAIGDTPAEFATVVKTDLDKWAKVIKAAGIRPES
jgi:tripartite-type tricarboxylate transporter receptor subunit TctC